MGLFGSIFNTGGNGYGHDDDDGPRVVKMGGHSARAQRRFTDHGSPSGRWLLSSGGSGRRGHEKPGGGRRGR